MSKTDEKIRLDEAQVRRFMGLANLAPLGEGFLDRYHEDDYTPTVEGGEGLAREAEEMPPEEGAEEMPPEEEMPPTEDAAAGATEMAQDVADAVADALTVALGKHGVEVTSGEAGDEVALPVDEPALDEPALDEPAGDEGLGDEPELEELDAAGINIVNDEALVQEVARRVAERLMKESKANSQPKPVSRKIRPRTRR